MKPWTRRISIAAAFALAAATGLQWWRLEHRTVYPLGDAQPFLAVFAPPPVRDSAQTGWEIEELLRIQRARTPAEVEAARADSKTDVSRFYDALGFDPRSPPDLPAVKALMERVEDSIRPYVHRAKSQFHRLRPPEIDSRIEPCIGGVKGDASYPSGHATYGYVIATLLSDMVPERRDALMRRADEFARQRMVCGVHFRSDIEAGRKAAQWLAAALLGNETYRRDSDAAARELKSAIATQTRRSSWRGSASGRLGGEESLHAFEEALATRRVFA